MTEKNRQPVSDVRLGRVKLYPTSLGDTWDPAWAEDGNLYYPGNDGFGWDKACSSNVFFNRSVGDDPFNLKSQTVNGMEEYDGGGQQREDGCTWKSSGCISLDGTLYLALGRHAYGTKSGDPHMRQTARRTSIIKSTDHGMSWVRSAQENYHHPMFENDFTTPYFIYYGQDGKTPEVDGADRYIYAISNNGFWCNGDFYVLGRIERSKMSRLDPADWTYYQGGDGSRDESWTRDPAAARPVIENPLKCGETGATYLPALGRYILVAWYYPGDPNVDADESHLIFYEAPHPWGPWAMIKEEDTVPQGWYCPRVLAKWQTVQADQLNTILVASGDYYEMGQYYRFIVAELAIKVGGSFPSEPPDPQPQVIASTDPTVQYSGAWRKVTDRDSSYSKTVTQTPTFSQRGATKGEEYYAEAKGAALTIHFNGTRLVWYASKENNLGIAAVSIDGGPESEVDLWTYCHVPQYQRLMFDSGPLAPGEHDFKVRVTGKKKGKSTSSGIFHDRVDIFSNKGVTTIWPPVS
jgi:hypothetical protein